jgi:uncharacterized protein YutE (UPF0331/DUF86 family)
MSISQSNQNDSRNGVIDRKLKLLETKLLELRSWEIGTFFEFQSNTMMRYATERILQICVEIVIDIGMRIVAIEKQLVAENASDMLSFLEKSGIIPDKHPFHKMVKFRNLVVHRYEYVDAEILYGIIKKNLSEFEQFADFIKKYQLKENRHST